jgi:hypothetical protein
MLLSTFEYIARGALLSWWDELINTAENHAGADQDRRVSAKSVVKRGHRYCQQ